jgi:cell division protein FtsL
MNSNASTLTLQRPAAAPGRKSRKQQEEIDFPVSFPPVQTADAAVLPQTKTVKAAPAAVLKKPAARKKAAVSKTKTREASGSGILNLNKAFRLIFVCFVIMLAAFLFSRIYGQSINSTLSASNQQLEAEIKSADSAISDLETEISQLQEKSRVLGMLEGQVSENQDNVYYYGQN